MRYSLELVARRCVEEEQRVGWEGGVWTQQAEADLCILNDEMARVEDQGDERGGKKHFDDADMAFLFWNDFLGAEDSVEGVGVEDAVAL